MHLTTLALALPLALPLATALRITKITHSGPACPDAAPLEITAAEDPSALSLSIPGLSTTLEAPMFAACALDLTLEEGEVGESLVLESVEVWGRLGLGEGARGRLMASAFWADDAEVLTNTSTTDPFDAYIFVPASLELPSRCVEDDGYVGILNVGFRVVANEGNVTFGPYEKGGRTVAVSEHLGVRWEECGE